MGVLSVTALFGYGALSLWWENTAGGKLVLWVPSTTFFLLMVAGPAVFLEVSPQPLLGSARWAGHGKYGQVLVAPSPCQHWLCILPCYVGLLILTGLCLDVWGYEGKFKIYGSAPLPVMAVLCFKLRSHIYQSLPWWGREKGDAFSWCTTSSALLNNPGHSVRDSVLPCYPPFCPLNSLEQWWVPNLICDNRPCPFSIWSPLLIPICPPSYVPMGGFFRCVCVLSRGSFIEL